MTIDDAIKYADMFANDASTVREIPMVVIQRLNMLCVKALRQMKKMNENAEISATPVQDTWQERMKRKYEAGMLNFTPKSSIELLKQQKRHMGEYLHDLEVRAEIEGVTLYD